MQQRHKRNKTKWIKMQKQKRENAWCGVNGSWRKVLKFSGEGFRWVKERLMLHRKQWYKHCYSIQHLKLNYKQIY